VERRAVTGIAGGDVYATWPPETFSGNAPGNISYTVIRSFVLRHAPEP